MGDDIDNCDIDFYRRGGDDDDNAVSPSSQRRLSAGAPGSHGGEHQVIMARPGCHVVEIDFETKGPNFHLGGGADDIGFERTPSWDELREVSSANYFGAAYQDFTRILPGFTMGNYVEITSKKKKDYVFFNWSFLSSFFTNGNV